VFWLILMCKCASNTNVSPPSAYGQVTYTVEDVDILAEEQEAENEDWENDVEFYEWTVFYWTGNGQLFLFCVRMVDGLHRATHGKCQFFTVVATRRYWDLTSRVRILENISSGGVISDNMH